MARLPTPGGDDGTWGNILNEYLSVNHDAGGFNAYQVAGGTVRRKLDDRLGEIKNVKDFGATGNGTTDDTAAIQRAVNYVSAPYSARDRGTIYFPVGNYRVTAPITYELGAGIFYIAFVGDPGARLSGSFPDAILKRSPNSPVGGIYNIQDLHVQNDHPSGKAIMMHSCVSGKIVRCSIGAFIGIETYNSQSILIDSCSIIRGGQHTLAGSVGIMAGNATAVISTDVTAYENGIRHQNLGLIVHGGRMEVNYIAIMLGRNENNTTFGSNATSIKGVSMESNKIGIYLAAGNNVEISGISITAAENSCQNGLYLHTGENVVVNGVNTSYTQTWLDAGIHVGNVKKGVFNACNAGGGGIGWKLDGGVGGADRLVFNGCGGTNWVFPSDHQGYQLINCTGPGTPPTVAQLPDAAPVGTVLAVSDSTSSVPGTTVSGGGSNSVAVVRSNNAWRII